METVRDNLREKVFSYTSYRGRFYPIIPVIIEGKEKTVVHALVGSGATVSLFHISIAEDAGIDLGDAERAYLAGVGGYVRAYVKGSGKSNCRGAR